MSLSVVTLTMNEPERLNETVVSINSQEGIRIEHLVVNGGADLFLPSDTPHLISRRVVAAPPTGVYQAMNLGLDLAQGSAIIFMHSGDSFFTPWSASQAVELVSQARWGHGAMLSVNGARMRIRTWRGYSRARHALGLTYVPHPSCVMRTDFLRSLGGFDPTMGVAADQWTVLKASAVTGPAITRKILAVHREDGMSAGRSPREIQAEFKRMRDADGRSVLGAKILDDVVAHIGSSARAIRDWARTQGAESGGVQR